MPISMVRAIIKSELKFVKTCGSERGTKFMLENLAFGELQYKRVSSYS